MQHEDNCTCQRVMLVPRLLAYHNKRTVSHSRDLFRTMPPYWAKFRGCSVIFLRCQIPRGCPHTTEVSMQVVLTFRIRRSKQRNQTKVHDYSPTQNHLQSPIQMLQIVRLYQKSVSIPLVAFTRPILIFAIVKMSRARMCDFLRLGDVGTFIYIEEMNRFLSAGGGLW